MTKSLAKKLNIKPSEIIPSKPGEDPNVVSHWSDADD